MHLSRNKKYCLIIPGLFLLLASLTAQDPTIVERSNNKVILEGTVYYIHVVKPGQTLYSISKAYNISQREIAIENPGVMSGLQMGQALKIPVKSKLAEEVDTSVLEDQPDEGRIHVVKRGETLYGIARFYDLDENRILDANQDVQGFNLQPGMRLQIPEKEEAEQEPAFNEEGFAYHKVKRRETLYSIARYYGVEMQEIRLANPELGWGGPKTDQVIRIPLPQTLDRPASLKDTISDVSTPFWESEKIPEDYQYEDLEFEHDNLRRTYRIAFFIPFDFHVPEPLDSLIKDVNSATRRNRIIERYRIEEKIPQSVNFLEFFQGSLMALDSLRQTGMKLDVRFFDTRKSVDHTLSILENNDLDNFDLFIGPFYPFILEVVSDFAYKHKIPLVTPFYNELDLIQFNPYLFQLSPSIEEEYREAAKLVASKHMYNIVYVREADSLGVEKHDSFKDFIFDALDDYSPEEPVVFKEVVQKLEHTDEIIHSLSRDKKNLVIVPTRNEALASRVVSQLYFKLDDYDIEVMGSPFWTEFSSIDYLYYHHLNLIFYSSFWVDYLDKDVDAFMNKYRSYFYNEPVSTTRKGINYGIIGYDMTFFFANALRMHGPRFILSMKSYQPPLVQKPFKFDRISNAGGYENHQITFYQFSPDMHIHEIEVPELPERTYFVWPLEDRHRKRYLIKERDWE